MSEAEARPEPGASADISELQADIEATRDELGQTVGALSEKLDVKARVQHKAADVVETSRRRPIVPVGVVLGVAAAAGVAIWWRRR